jgi:uroporphyrinogen III methyltransferase/synthase
MTGKVYLVGAGPGDPGLITVKGLACIAQADVIVYDYLASTALLRHATPHAEQIYVGKKGGDHTLSQDEINALLVRKAKANRVVTRLKGGDPFIFGRGGEEAEILQAAGIPFEIVPGVTSAIAAPAYAGIPLTHRKYTATVALVTGHEDPTKAQSNIDWPALARMGTLVLLMGVKNLPLIVEQLRAAGMPPTRPVALIRWGTTAKQQTVTGTLETIVDRVHKAQLRAPAIIVIGDVVQLQPVMQWFENRPLWGKTILVTRAREQASDLVNRLTALGANCIESPTIQVVPPDDLRPLDQALDQLARYDWVVFTSVNGVGFFFKRLFERGQDVRALSHLRTATIGPATAARLREYGLTSDIIPASYRAEAVVEAFEQEQVDGRRVLLPRAAEARPVLPQELTRMGAEVDEITVYHTQPVVAHTETLLQLLESRQIDLITFTSSSTVTNFIGLLPAERRDQLLQGVAVACIGPITADTAKKFQLPVDIMAQEYTIPGLCDAILGHYHPESINTA